ncbi:MAG: MFS transporter [Anaerolineae bacterium]|nr:MFS transporter [Anaerolineae bacterium]
MQSDTDTTPRGWRSLPRNIWVMTLTSFLTDISSEMVLNLLPLFLANVLGVKTNVIGLIEGTAESLSSLLKIVSGNLSDRMGQRKRLAVAGYGISAFAKPLLYFATSWFGVAFIRFLDRVGKGVRTAPRDALIADSTPDDRRGLAFGLHRAGDTLGAVIGVGLALVIVLATQSGAVELGRVTFQTVVLFSAIPGVLAVVVLAFGAHEQPRASATQTPGLALRGLPSSFKAFLLILALFTLGNSADAFLLLRAQERGLSVPGVLLMLLTFNLVYASVSVVAGRFSDRVGRKRLILIGWAVYAVLYLGFALAQTTWQVWALYAAYGIYYGMFDGTAKALVADLVPAHLRGSAYGIYNGVIALAALPASLLAGILWQGIGSWAGLGASAPFVAGALLAGAAALLLTIWQPRTA